MTEWASDTDTAAARSHIVVGGASTGAHQPSEAVPVGGVDVVSDVLHAPDTFVDISATLEQKVLTLSKHASQFPDPDRPAKSVRDHARQVGEQAGLGSAEAFRVVPFAPDPLLVG